MKKLLLIFLTSLSFYAKAQNQNISQAAIFDGEPYIAINPFNSQHLVTAWMGYKLGQLIVIKTKYSMDGGVTWSTETFPPHAVSGYQSADPSIQFDHSGNVFLCYIDYDGTNFTGGGVYIAKSVDGGASWGTPVEVISLNDCPSKYCIDRAWMVIDRSSSANQGTIYVTTMNADQPVTPPYNPYLTVSTDGGASFQTPRYLDTIGYLAGSTIAQPMPSPTVGSDGTFYGAYPSYLSSQNLFAQYILASSIDAGVTLTHSQVIQGTSSSAVTDPYAKTGQLLRADPSNSDHLACFFVAQNNGDADILMSETYNAGGSWSSLERVNNDPVGNGIVQDMVWADFDTDGDLVVTWRDRRNSGTSGYQVATEIYARVRWKDSTDFSNEIVLTDAPVAHDAVLEGNGNDFMGVAFANDTLYAVWGDVRTTKLNIWLNKLALSSGTSSITSIYEESMIELIPNPSSEIIQVQGLENKGVCPFELFDYSGKKVLFGKISHGETVDISRLPQGTYFLRIIIDEELRTTKLLKQ